MWKEKKFDKINIEDSGYPHVKLATFLVKFEDSHFTKVVVSLFLQKDFPDHRRECLFTLLYMKIIKRRSFASFLWSVMWKEKKFDKINNEDSGYPHVKLATFLVKFEDSYFTKVVAPFFCKKTFPTKGGCVFLRPDLCIKRLELAVI